MPQVDAYKSILAYQDPEALEPDTNLLTALEAVEEEQVLQYAPKGDRTRIKAQLKAWRAQAGLTKDGAPDFSLLDRDAGTQYTNRLSTLGSMLQNRARLGQIKNTGNAIAFGEAMQEAWADNPPNNPALVSANKAMLEAYKSLGERQAQAISAQPQQDQASPNIRSLPSTLETAPVDDPKADGSLFNYIGDTIRGFGRGAASSSLIGSAGQIYEAANYDPDNPQEGTLSKYIQDIGPEESDTFQQVVEGLGNVVGFVVGGFGIGGLVAKGAAKFMSKGVAATAAAKVGQRAGQAWTFSAGAAMGSVEQWNDYLTEIESGGVQFDEATQTRVMALGAIGGTLDSLLPIALKSRIFSKVGDKVYSGRLAKLGGRDVFGTSISGLLGAAALEGSTEVAQTILQEAVAEYNYDHENRQDLSLAELQNAGGIGATVGAIATLGFNLIAGKKGGIKLDSNGTEDQGQPGEAANLTPTDGAQEISALQAEADRAVAQGNDGGSPEVKPTDAEAAALAAADDISAETNEQAIKRQQELGDELFAVPSFRDGVANAVATRGRLNEVDTFSSPEDAKAFLADVTADPTALTVELIDQGIPESQALSLGSQLTQDENFEGRLRVAIESSEGPTRDALETVEDRVYAAQMRLADTPPGLQPGESIAAKVASVAGGQAQQTNKIRSSGDSIRPAGATSSSPIDQPNGQPVNRTVLQSTIAKALPANATVEQTRAVAQKVAADLGDTIGTPDGVKLVASVNNESVISDQAANKISDAYKGARAGKKTESAIRQVNKEIERLGPDANRTELAGLNNLLGDLRAIERGAADPSAIYSEPDSFQLGENITTESDSTPRIPATTETADQAFDRLINIQPDVLALTQEAEVLVGDPQAAMATTPAPGRVIQMESEQQRTDRECLEQLQNG